MRRKKRQGYCPAQTAGKGRQELGFNNRTAVEGSGRLALAAYQLLPAAAPKGPAASAMAFCSYLCGIN